MSALQVHLLTVSKGGHLIVALLAAPAVQMQEPGHAVGTRMTPPVGLCFSVVEASSLQLVLSLVL